MTILSEQDLRQYEEHGWVAPIDVMAESEAADILAAFEDAERRYPQELHAEHRNNAHLVFPFLADLVLDNRIVDAVETLVGPDIALTSTVLFVKEPDSSSFVSWHQDAFYMGLDGHNFVTAWFALTPSTRDSGCVSVIPGTHRSQIDHHDTFEEDNILTRGQLIADVDPSTAVDLVLRPGQMSLHHPWLVHGSQPNQSSGRRIGIAMQSYLAADVRPARGEHYVMPIRGASPHSSFPTVSPPDAECDQAGSTARAQANAALSSVLYDGAKKTRSL